MNNTPTNNTYNAPPTPPQQGIGQQVFVPQMELYEEQTLKKREFWYLWDNINWQSASFLLWLLVIPSIIRSVIDFAGSITGNPITLSDPAMQFWFALFANGLAFLPFFIYRGIKPKNLLFNRPERLKKFTKIWSILGLFLIVFGLNLLAGMFSQWLSSVIPGGQNSVSGFEYSLSMSGLDKFYYIAAVTIIAPIGEEIMYRGGVLMPLRRYGDGFAILFSGFFFGLMHGNLQQVPGAMVMGMFWGYIACKSDSIIPGIILHFLNNTLVTISEILRVKSEAHLEITGQDLPIAVGFEVFFTIFILAAFLATIVLFGVLLFKMISGNHKIFGGDYRLENWYRIQKKYMPNRFLACISAPLFLLFFFMCVLIFASSFTG